MNLIRKGYLSGSVSTTYNNLTGTATKLALSGNGISSSITISNMTEAEKENVALNISLSFNTSKSEEMQTYLSSLPTNTYFSFRLSLEMEKTS